MIGDRDARVVVAVRYDGPAVVFTGNDQVQLVTVPRAHLVDPQPSLGIEGDAQHVAVADGPELPGNRTAILPRVVSGHGAVVVQTQHLAEIAVKILGRFKFLALPGGDEHLAVGAEGDAMAVMSLAGDFGGLDPESFQGFQLGRAALEIELGTNHHGPSGVFILPVFGIRKINPGITLEIRMQHHVAQTALAAIGDVPQALHLGFRPVLGNMPQHPLLLGHQQRTVGQEGHGPGFIELGDLRGCKRGALRAFNLKGSG